MLKQGGVWQSVDWQTALEYIANGLKQIKSEHGAASIGALVSPHSTLEELQLASGLMSGMGSPNIDYRLRNAEFDVATGVRYLGTSIASLSDLQRVLVIGSSLRKDHPLFAQRIRQAVRKGCVVNSVQAKVEDWALPVANTLLSNENAWVQALADIATAVANEKGITAPAFGTATETACAIARSLLGGERKSILLGNMAAHHAKASSLLLLANWIGAEVGGTVGYLTEASNTVGAQLAGAVPGPSGMNAADMLSGSLKAVLLLNTEPEFDSAAGASCIKKLMQSQMVITLSPFKSNMAFSDVLLPIAPFTETSGTFINAEGRVQSFHAVVKPLGETRPGWKVLRVLANMLDIPGFDFDSSKDVLASVTCLKQPETTHLPLELLSNRCHGEIDPALATVESVVAGIYDLDGTVRRAASLQRTADAKSSKSVQEVAA
jgi:NADH-quinone oxidoreductase subunit G